MIMMLVHAESIKNLNKNNNSMQSNKDALKKKIHHGFGGV